MRFPALLLRVIPLLLVIFCARHAQAQVPDTLSVSLLEADRMFLKNNLILLAQQYNLQVADAQVIQAKLYPNPVFSADFNAYDPQNNKVLHVGQTGQKSFSLEQIILLGGKRRSLIELARQNRELALAELEDLLRNLRFQLHSSFYQLHQQQAMVQQYKSQLNLLDTIIGFYEVQGGKGNVALKEVVRLKAARLQLTSDRAEVYHGSIEEMERLRVLLRTEAFIAPAVADTTYARLEQGGQLANWLQLAEANRPDLRSAGISTVLADLNLKYQRQLAVPDMAVNTSYDQRGGAFINQINAGVSIGLPVWNRNRGGIAAARIQTQAAVAGRDLALTQVRADVLSAYEHMQLSIREYRNAQQFYGSDFEVVYKGVSVNFRKRNISLIEFLDFLESYTSAIVEVERAKAQLGIAAERVNHAVNAPQF